MNELWITGGTVLTLNPSRAILPDTDVYIVDGTIKAIGRGDNFPPPGDAEKVIDASGKIVAPGFINAHTHADCILVRGGLGQDQNLFDWRAAVTDPVRQLYTEEDLEAAIELYSIEAIRSGITTVVDLVGFRESWRHEVVLKTYARMGLRLIYCPMFTDKSMYNMPVYETTDEGLKRVQQFLDRDHLSAGGRIKIWVSPRLARSTTPEGLRRSVELAKSYATFTTTHCAETTRESQGSSITTVEYLAQSGYLSERSVLAHCVWVTASDIEALVQTQTRVVHCPSTNMYLASGVAPIPQLLEAGIHVGLGTDNANANNQVSMAMEMREAALLHKGVNHNPPPSKGRAWLAKTPTSDRSRWANKPT
ncbi:MAG: amidohydrolase family protein [Thermoleophilia bacterium]